MSEPEDQDLPSPVDALVVGTAFAEAAVAAALARAGDRVLHVDRNAYYGGSGAGFSLGKLQAWAAERTERAKSRADEEVGVQLTAADRAALAAEGFSDVAVVPLATRDAAVVLSCAAAVLDRAAAGAPDPLRYADAPPARPPVLASPDVLALMEILENCAAPPSPAAAATLRLRLAEALAAAFVHENRRDQRDAGAAAVGRHPDPAPAFSLSAAELLASPELI